MDPVEWALLRSGLFKTIDPELFRSLRQSVQVLRFSAGEVIVREGEPGDAMYVVQEGSVQVYTQRKEGDPLVLAKLEQGAYFGEQSLLPGRSGLRNASVRAHSDVTLLRIDHDSFQRLLAEDHPLKEHLLDWGARQLRESSARQSTLFRVLTAELDDAEALPTVTFVPGTVLFHEGDAADCMYLLLAGRAAIHRTGADGLTRINTVEEGQCVGELGLLRNAPRLATAIAETEVRALRVPREWFQGCLETSPELRSYLQTIERVYTLPRRGLVTQHAGRWMDREAVTTIYHQAGGRRVLATRIIGEDLFHLECVGRQDAPRESMVLRYEPDPHVLRELSLDANGRFISILVHGYWSELPELLLLAIEDKPIPSVPDAQAFARSGSILAAEKPDTLERKICTCIDVSARAILEAMDAGCKSFSEVQTRTRCGTVCGACTPWVMEILGQGEWTPVRILEEIPVAENIRSFRLAPLEGKLVRPRPGQHIVVEAKIEGHWISRAYTLTSAPGSSAHYEITVKSEPRGTFSRWLFDRMDPEPRIRVSKPRGEYHWDPAAGRPAVCLVAGIGMTPALAILRTLAEDGFSQKVHMHYSARSRTEFAYATELMDIAKHRQNVHIEFRETSRNGRLSESDIHGLVHRYPEAEFFLCGPGSYLQSVSALLSSAGVPPDRIRIEAFSHAGDPPPAPTGKRLVVTKAAVEPAPRTEMLVAPQKRPRRIVVAALKTIGNALSYWLNHPIWDWKIGGAQLNPYRWAADSLAERWTGIDPRLPREYLATLGVLSIGPAEHHLRVFRRLERRGGGDTYAQTIPNPPFEPYQGRFAVDTGWTHVFDGPLVPMIITRSRSLIGQVLENPDRFDRGALPYHHLQQVVGMPDIRPDGQCKAAGLFAGQMHENLTWQRDRKLGVATFGAPMLDNIATTMTRALEEIGLEIDWQLSSSPSVVVDAGAMMLRVAFQMVVRSMFGALDSGLLARLTADLRPCVLATLDYVVQRTYALPASRQDFEHNMLRLHKLVEELVEAIRAAHATGRLGSDRSPVIDLVTHGTEQRTLTARELFPFLLVALIAGHETTGHTMAWAIDHLGRDPDLLHRVRTEVDAFYAAQPGRVLGATDCRDRPWTQALLYEIGRFHPPLIAVPRSARADGEIAPDPATGSPGFRYRKDTAFICSIIGVHRDPKRWKEPERFRPERFFDQPGERVSPAESGRRVWDHARSRERDYDLLTFSAGTGRCLGQDFNMLEFFLVLDFLLRRYDVQLVNPKRVVRDSTDVISGPEPGSIIVRIGRRAGILAGASG